MLSVTVDRSFLALGNLVFGDHPSAGLWVPEDGIARPRKFWNRTIASSPLTNGTVETRSRLEHTDTGLRSIYAGAATSAALEALMDEVEEALFQFSYPLTVTIDGQSKTWTCDRADVDWGNVESGLVKAYMARATLSIPCHPVAGGGGATEGLYVVAPTVPMP